MKELLNNSVILNVTLLHSRAQVPRPTGHFRSFTRIFTGDFTVLFFLSYSFFADVFLLSQIITKSLSLSLLNTVYRPRKLVWCELERVSSKLSILDWF